MTNRKGKRGQIAIFLVLILAGLVMLFALNVDIFTSARSKIRLQNAADASALALARWQGVTLNMIGDLNLAHLAAICNSNRTAISGIVTLQQRLAFIGPTLGFKAANDIAKENGVGVSRDMTTAMRLISGFMGDEYRRMLDVILRDGIRAGVDNAAIVKPGNVDPRVDPDFYAAIKNRDFRTLCVRYAGGAHQLPSIPPDAPDPEEILLSGCNACFGNIGIGWESGSMYINRIGTLSDLAHYCGIDESYISEQGLLTNATLFTEKQWCIYDRNEWRDMPDEFGFSRFPWLTPMKDQFAITGGSSTIRVEGFVSLTAIAAQTNYLGSQAAAKILGSVGGQKVTAISPPLVLPSFARARLVPFGPGAAGRYGMSYLSHIRGLLGLLAKNNGASSYLGLLDVFNSDEFRDAAEKWYSDHGHTDADGCKPLPHNGTERGGGTPYGI